MPKPSPDEHDHQLVWRSRLYREYCLKREQILKYKWIESEKVGRDIGLDKAWIQWEAKHYRKWKTAMNHGETDAPPPAGPNETPSIRSENPQ